MSNALECGEAAAAARRGVALRGGEGRMVMCKVEGGMEARIG